MNRPGRRDGNAKDHTNGARFDYRRKSFVVVYAMLLGIAMTDPASFVAREGSIGVKLVTKDPFPDDNISIGWSRDKLPIMIIKKCIEFILHGSGPIMVKKSSFV